MLTASLKVDVKLAGEYLKKVVHDGDDRDVKMTKYCRKYFYRTCA